MKVDEYMQVGFKMMKQYWDMREEREEVYVFKYIWKYFYVT